MQGSGRRTNYIAFLEQSAGSRFKSWAAHHLSRFRFRSCGSFPMAGRNRLIRIEAQPLDVSAKGFNPPRYAFHCTERRTPFCHLSCPTTWSALPSPRSAAPTSRLRHLIDGKAIKKSRPSFAFERGFAATFRSIRRIPGGAVADSV